LNLKVNLVYNIAKNDVVKLPVFLWNIFITIDFNLHLRAGRPGFDSLQVLGRDIFLFTTASRPVLGPVESSTQLRGLGGDEVGLADRIHLVPRLRMCGAIPPLPQCVFMAWCN
jgi:hypothetical protein